MQAAACIRGNGRALLCLSFFLLLSFAHSSPAQQVPPGTVSCTESDDRNGEYYKACSVTCGPADWGYSVDISIYGDIWDARIGGYGWVETGSYGVALQCVNGWTASWVNVEYDTEAWVDFDNWVAIPIPAPPAVTINPVTTPTNLQSQMLSGTMKTGSTIAVTCPTATVGSVTYPTSTSWTATLNMQPGNNAITVIATDSAGTPSALQTSIMLRLLSERFIQKEAGWAKPLRATSLWDFK